MSKQMKYVALFAIPHACIILFFLIVFFSNLATPFIPGFAADSKGRLYIGENARIAIYLDGQLVDSIEPRSRTYTFTVDTDDHILVAYPSSFDLMDAQGNVLSSTEDAHSTMYSQLQSTSRTFSSINGDRYKKVGALGWTRIVKNDSEVVYRISAFSFIMKCLISLCALSMFINGTRIVYRGRKYHANN